MNPWTIIGWGFIGLIALPIAIGALMVAALLLVRALSAVASGIHRHPAAFIVGLTVLIVGAVMVAIQVSQ